MTRTKRLLISLGLSLAVWLVLAWPLPRYFSTGIPMSSQNVEKGHVRAMIPGDHLQLLYRFELMRHMLDGRVRWFHNVYEFNTGDDAARCIPSAHYAPFSLVYAPLAAVGGRAFAWNLTGFVSLWLTYLLTWLLVRRYVASEPIAGAAALLGLLLPYRWVALLGGSPTGFAMLWIPAVWLGLDLALRDERPAGGALAGLSLLFLCWTDLQSFFFCALAAPAWVLLALLQRWPLPWRERGLYVRLFKALLPLALCLVLVALYSALRHQSLMAAEMAAGRDLGEVGGFSPLKRALVLWRAEGLQSHIYVGFVAPLFLLAGGGALIERRRREAAGWVRALLTYALIGAVLAGIVALAVGTNGPCDGRLLKAARRLVPPYAMVRQTAKIFCLLPSFLALGGALAAAEIRARFGPRRTAVLLAATLAAAAVEMGAQVRTTVCLLNNEQGAYRAVADDARRANILPRVLVLPIWPGNDASSSLYEYYVQLYGIRMLNGYSPAVSRAYIRDMYEPLRGANQGWLPDGALDDLLQRDIRYVLLHENLFPEKVSPFPVMTTLDRLREHPRLDFLAHAEAVWAFRIRPAPRTQAAARPWPGCAATGCARRWEMEDCERHGGRAGRAGDAGGRAYLALARPDEWVRTRPTRVAPIGRLRWLIRLRGEGALTAVTLADDGPIATAVVAVATNRWQWREIPLAGLTNCASVALRLSHSAGQVAADAVLLTAGDWREPAVGERLALPAPCLFHGGHTDPDRKRVVLRTATDPYAAILYGPKLPFAPGRYAAELRFDSSAAPGTDLGRLYVEGQDEQDWVVVAAGQGSARLEWEQRTNLPLNLVFVYLRNADMAIEEITIERLVAVEP